MVYREEVLTVMGVIGDIRDELRQIKLLLQEDDGEEEEEADS